MNLKENYRIVIIKDNIIYLPSTDLRNVLYIIKEGDLPKFKFTEPQDNEIKELELEKISSEYKIYSSVIDINKPEFEELQHKYRSDSNLEELEILITLAFFLEIRYKFNRKVIQLKINSIFEEQGSVNEINEIKPL